MRNRALILTALTLMTACSKTRDTGGTKTEAAASEGSSADSGEGVSADAAFLRALSNHQAGLMFLAHVAHQHPDSVSVRAEALALD